MNEKLNDKNITFHEIMTLAGKSEDPAQYLRNIMKKDSRLNVMFGYALNPKFKSPLPAGIPPYIPSLHPVGVAPLEILNLSNKYYIMFSKDLKQFQKEQILVQWMEDMSAEDAIWMIHIKDQTLHTVLPTITFNVLLDAMGWTEEQYNKISGKTTTPA